VWFKLDFLFPQGGVKKAIFGPFLVVMGSKDCPNPQKSPQILPFPVENRPPRLSVLGKGA